MEDVGLLLERNSVAYIISRPWGGHCGIGHQFHNWIVAWQLAKYHGLRFVHAPFCGDSTEPQIDTPVKFWENFLNFGQDELLESHLPKNIHKIRLPHLPWKQNMWLQNTCDNKVWEQTIKGHRDDDVLFECERNQFMRLDQSCLQHHILRTRYWEARRKHPISCFFDTTKLNVAIHIRRGDVTSNSSAKDRWMNMKVYTNVINQIRNASGDCVVFHIYSDGTIEDLKRLIDLPDIILHLQEDVFSTFHHMVLADVLVASKSSFSALAGHLQHKVKIVQSWNSIANIPSSLKRSVGLFTWENFPDNEHFVTMDDTGKLDIDCLRTQLDEVRFQSWESKEK